MTYQNASGEVKTYEFDSYVLIPSGPHLHLVGVSHSSLAAGFDTVIRLRLDQVLEFKLLREYFAKPDFDVADYARRHLGPFHQGGECVTVRVQFGPDKAQYIRHTKRHHSQRVEDQQDGSMIWQIEAPLTQDLMHWIASYGSNARVLGPKERVLE